MPWQVVIFAKDTLYFSGNRFRVERSVCFGGNGKYNKRFGI